MTRHESTPYDLVAGRVCADILQPFQHETTLQFDVPGEAIVVVVGRTFADKDGLIEREFAVTVF